MSNRLVLDLNLGTAHLMDIIEGPAGYGADSVLLRYQAPCTDEDQDIEGDNLQLYEATAALVQQPQEQQQQQQQQQHDPELPPLIDDDTLTVKSASSTTESMTSSSTTGPSTSSIDLMMIGTTSNTAAHRHLGAYQLHQQQQQERANTRRRHCQRRKRQQELLDDHIWFVVTLLERRRKLLLVQAASEEADAALVVSSLRHISIRFVGCTFPAPALAWLLQQAAPQAETLQLRVTLAGPMEELAVALQHHPQLSQVTMDHCRPAFPETTTTASSLDSSDSSTTRKRRGHQRGQATGNDEYYRKIDKSSCNNNSNNNHGRIKRKNPPPQLASLEPLLDALAESQTLRSLTLSHCTIAFTVNQPNASRMILEEEEQQQQQSPKASAWNAGISLSHFLRRSAALQNGSLTKLCLEHMTEIRDEDFATMMSALEGNKSRLRTLSIRQCAVGTKAGQAMGRMLATNTSLQTLDVNIHWWDGMTYEETPEGQYVAQCWETDVASLVQGLSTNSHLQCLGLYCDNVAYSHSASAVSILGDSVEASVRRLCATTLEALPKIFQSSAKTASSTPGQKRLRPSENRSLEDIIVGHRSFGLTSEIDFYLNWNRAGRDYFCDEDSNATAADWVDALLNFRGDLSVVYALVSMNPAMFPHAITADTK